MSELTDLKQDFERDLAGVSDPQALEAVRIRYMGRKGIIAEQFKQMSDLGPDDRRARGAALNELKNFIETKLKEVQSKLSGGARPVRSGTVDVTLPGRPNPLGLSHPVMTTLDDICEIFRLAGFEIASGPEVETDWYNFGALNVPVDHPARDMHDTFYLKNMGEDGRSREKPGEYLLRTHTSPVQIHVMEKTKPPVRVIAPGRVYRRDDDITHSPMFHQVEGLWVDEGVTLRDLMGLLDHFAKTLFGDSVRTRFRPSFFPFTEPSIEMDISCVICAGGADRNSGCRTCKSSGWLEILGAGMVHPNVFRAVKYNPARVTGLAFGMGVDRITMLRYAIDDLRLLFENDLRFLAQFGIGR